MLKYQQILGKCVTMLTPSHRAHIMNTDLWTCGKANSEGA